MKGHKRFSPFSFRNSRTCARILIAKIQGTRQGASSRVQCTALCAPQKHRDRLDRRLAWQAGGRGRQTEAGSGAGVHWELLDLLCVLAMLDSFIVDSVRHFLIYNIV